MHPSTEAHIIYLCEKSLEFLVATDFDGAHSYLVVARAEAGDSPTVRVRAALDGASTKLNMADPSRCDNHQNVASSVALPLRINLTSCERRILELVAEGLQDKDIGERLSVSVRTVQNHLKRVYDKLDIRNRTEVARLMFGKQI